MIIEQNNEHSNVIIICINEKDDHNHVENTIHNFIIFHVSSHLRWQHFSRASKMQLLALALSILLEKSWCWIIYNVLLLNVDIITIVDIRTLENGWEPQNLRMAKHWYSSMYTLSAQQESQNPPIVWNGKWVHTHPIILKLVIAVHLWQSMGTASGLSGSEEPGIECERLGNQDMPKHGNHQPTQKLPCTSNDQISWSIGDPESLLEVSEICITITEAQQAVKRQGGYILPKFSQGPQAQHLRWRQSQQRCTRQRFRQVTDEAHWIALRRKVRGEAMHSAPHLAQNNPKNLCRRILRGHPYHMFPLSLLVSWLRCLQFSSLLV